MKQNRGILFLLAIGALRLVAMLPFRLLYVLSDCLYVAVYHVVRYRRKVVRENLARAFPEKTVPERMDIECRFYHHICDNVVETIKLLHVSDAEMLRRVDIRNAHIIEEAAAEKRPVFLLMAHFGNWEWVQEISRRVRRPDVCGEIYRPLASPTGDAVMQAIRSRYQTLLIPQAKAVRTIIGLRRTHPSYLIGFIADQRPTRTNLHHWTTFFRQDTPYLVGAEEIGRHVNAKYVYLHMEKPLRGHYTMTIREMPSDQLPLGDYPYTLLYLQWLEEDIRDHPELWLWSHKRWKHKKIDDKKLST